MNRPKSNLKPTSYRAGEKTSAPSPSTTSRSRQHQVSIVHHEHGNVEIQDNQDYGSLFHINMIRHVNTINSNAFEVREVKSAEQFVGVMVLDSGCQRTCCGKSWYRDHQQLLRNYGLVTREFDISEEFQFGKGTPTTSTTRAFLPSTLGAVPLLLGAAVLPESIPLLGSNQLLRRLGAIIDFVNHRVAFNNLVDDSGRTITVPMSILGGQLTITITSLFKDEHILFHPFWKRVSSSEVWIDPDPEVITEHLKVQEPIENNSQTLSADSDVPATTTMARSLEEVDHGSQDLHEEPDLSHDVGHQPQAHGPRMPSDASPLCGDSGQHPRLPTRAVQEIRQCTRPVCNMSEVRPRVEVERRSQRMGSSWTGKILSTIATLASTILINDPGFRTCAQEQGLSISQAKTFEEGTDQGEDIYDIGVYGAVADMGPLRSGDVTSQRRPVQRGLPNHRTKVTTGKTPKGLDGSCFPERTSVPGGQERHRSGGQRKAQSEVDRVGLHRSGRRRSVQLGAGLGKRLRGLWKKSAKTLEFECMINEKVGQTVKQRPPPNIDLMEMFAGSARLTSMTHEYNLNATQPFDLIYGMDFKDEKQRSSIFRTVKRLRPWLIPMGVTCTHWNLFNINMNYNTDERKEILRFLQADDEVLVDFAVDLAWEQIEHGRLFLIENPLRSKLWTLPRMVRLMEQLGVWSVNLDLGAFGAEVDGKMICKPMRLVGNQPGLNETLHQRLTKEQKEMCYPIQGQLTTPSQQYPEHFCNCVLGELKAWVHQHEPQRFADAWQAFPATQPVEDLSQWSPIIEEVARRFERTSKRPFLIDLNSEMGKRVADLSRMDLTKIQACWTPTSRRIPSNIDEYFTRGALLHFGDGTRSLEVEDLDEIAFPRQRFEKPVQVAIFFYGYRKQVEPHEAPKDFQGHPAVAGLSTDISFPKLSNSNSINEDVRRSVARLHLNLGHPSNAELMRLLASQGDVPQGVIQAVQSLRCATCERLKPPQQPRPTAMPRMIAGQFGDELQMDVFYTRNIKGENFAILGIVDRATGYHQAGVMTDRSSTNVFQLFHDRWLKPFGLPRLVRCDPDTSFRGEFQRRLEAMGCLVEHCPAESHFVIGMIERRNGLLRIVVEKLVDQHAILSTQDLEVAVSSACHSLNSTAFTKGRSAYAAVFGRIPRLTDDVLTDEFVLASSSQVHDDAHNPALRAEMIRSEAAKVLLDLNMSKQLRRALLRKTRDTKIPDIQAGQRCAVWRWNKKGLRKRGSWVMSRFLSWDPSAVGRQAWVKMGTTTTLVTSEQLRQAYGFEDWNPSFEDVKALKDASQRFEDHMMVDERGPAPSGQQQLHDYDDIENDLNLEFRDTAPPPTPTMMVPATPAPIVSPTTPSPQLPRSRSPPKQEITTTTTNIQVNIDSPTNHNTQANYYRFGDLPQQQRRHRSRTPTQRRGQQMIQSSPKEIEPVSSAETPAAIAERPATTTDLGITQAEQQASQAPEAVSPQVTILEPQIAEQGNQQQPAYQADHTEQQLTEQPQQHMTQHETEAAGHQQQLEQEQGMDTQPVPTLPAKRTFDALPTWVMEEGGVIRRLSPHWDGSPFIGYGPQSKTFHHCYLTTEQRQQDLHQVDKDPYESDTTCDSSDEESKTSPDNAQGEPGQRLTRQEMKALDREIPWREIIRMPSAYVDKFLASIDKEAMSWLEWRSVRPLSSEECKKVLRDKTLSRRILRSRALYRDKNVGRGEVRAKCRVVCLGHTDPDIYNLTRSAPTPGRVSEHMMFIMVVAGFNKELLDSGLQWRAWLADASTAFLQGSQSDSERSHPLYMWAPKDPLIEKSGHWKADVYEILGNVYGLSNAPHLWAMEVSGRLSKLGYEQMDFDRMVFTKRDANGSLVSAILVYVDDFLGVYRSDYDLSEVVQAFRWGDWNHLEAEKPATFKGKELTVFKGENGRFRMKISMKKFIDGLQPGKIQRGRLQGEQVLNDQEKQEYRSVAGCLQWVSTQCRPEVGPAVSLSNHGNETTISDLRSLYETIEFLKSTPSDGIVLPDLPLNQSTIVLTYTDSSWANASRSGSQIGVVVGLTEPKVLKEPAPFSVIDWRSSRSPRVCRSTLAAEATAADEGADRAAYANMMIQ